MSSPCSCYAGRLRQLQAGASLRDQQAVAVGISDQAGALDVKGGVVALDDLRRDRATARRDRTRGRGPEVARMQHRLPVREIVGAEIRGGGAAVAGREVLEELDAGTGGAQAGDAQVGAEHVV